MAEAIGAQPDEVVFTSGGTESVALAIWGGVRAMRELGTRVVVGAVEHPAVGGVGNALQSDGFEMVEIPADEYGRIDLDRYVAEIRVPGTLLASVQHANHELGTMQQIGEAARLAREAKVRFHTDACQTVGRLPVDVAALGVDLLSLSAHKFGGPPGVGRAVRATRRRRHRLSVRRRPRAQAPIGHGEHPRHRGMAAALTRLARRHAGQAARTVGADGAAARAHRGARCPAPACTGTPPIAPRTSCASAWRGWTQPTLMMALDDRGFRLAAGLRFARGRPERRLARAGTDRLAGHAARSGSALGPQHADEDVTRSWTSCRIWSRLVQVEVGQRPKPWPAFRPPEPPVAAS